MLELSFILPYETCLLFTEELGGKAIEQLTEIFHPSLTLFSYPNMRWPLSPLSIEEVGYAVVGEKLPMI